MLKSLTAGFAGETPKVTLGGAVAECVKHFCIVFHADKPPTKALTASATKESLSFSRSVSNAWITLSELKPYQLERVSVRNIP